MCLPITTSIFVDWSPWVFVYVFSNLVPKWTEWSCWVFVNYQVRKSPFPPSQRFLMSHGIESVSNARHKVTGTSSDGTTGHICLPPHVAWNIWLRQKVPDILLMVTDRFWMIWVWGRKPAPLNLLTTYFYSRKTGKQWPCTDVNSKKGTK